MSEAQNVSSRRCACGEILVRGLYEGDRAIMNLQTEEIVAPVTLTCLNGHTQELWMSPDEGKEAIRAVLVVA